MDISGCRFRKDTSSFSNATVNYLYPHGLCGFKIVYGVLTLMVPESIIPRFFFRSAGLKLTDSLIFARSEILSAFLYSTILPKSVRARPSHKLCKPPERCKIESTDQEVLLWREEIVIRNVKQSGKR